jgi:ubiquitin-protein ligase
MTTPRDRRLLSDLRQMEELAARGQLTFRTEGNPPELYHVMVSAPGLALSDGALAVRQLHRFDAYLHRDYPRRPPVVTWQTPVFHPNLLGPERNGGVCIGSWSASESLADLCARLCDLVTYRSLNPGDALNADAGAWALEHDVRPGSDVADLAGLALGAPPAIGRPGTPAGTTGGP